MDMLCRNVVLNKPESMQYFQKVLRLRGVVKKLEEMGCKEGDTVSIRGGALHKPEVPLQGHNDHRIVMALAVTALAAGQPAVIRGAEAVNKSWPDFFEVLRALGAKIDTEPTA